MLILESWFLHLAKLGRMVLELGGRGKGGLEPESHEHGDKGLKIFWHHSDCHLLLGEVHIRESLRRRTQLACQGSEFCSWTLCSLLGFLMT